ncbi:uncharacterized protein C8orf88 homolog [Erpetoichthys calabaricus]|uniref:uncharacterized protein C8orf88 homolog n=1 Tax=Erpetoichthys calabaricus TaxID=27687 RepID=UPI00109F93B1|nr:uncharacterized protein C8orf88 homolog [Erpetoichthys calabaricus]
MEGPKRRIYKALQPAKPLRRLSEPSQLDNDAVNCKNSLHDEDHMNNRIQQVPPCKDSSCLPKVKVEMKERITYTREFLLSLAHCPISKKKPSFLPILPVVLEEPRKLLYAFSDSG